MAKSNNTLCLDKFYPERDLIITDIAQQSDKIIIRMKSTSSSCKCPKCNHITQKYHGTYTRKVQDLPILGKQVQLEICSHEYACEYSCAVGSSAIIRYYCYIPCTSTLLQATACHIFHTLYVLSFLICY
ncbi:transposase family protein [Catenibacterium sp.]|uniref:transposase family protein n=1 Tax=Catenibacterium sp. TaxID=2049022 RepID=UPI003995D847